MKALSIVTNCSNRKSVTPAGGALARSLPRGTANSLAIEWGRRIKRVPPVVRAFDLYQGRAFFEACLLAKEAGGGLFITSAGLGFVDSVNLIPSYSLTVSQNSEDSIQSRCDDEIFSPLHWWASLTKQFGVMNPISNLIKRSRNRNWLFSIPKSYFDLVAFDLMQLNETQLSRVRIVGPQVDREYHVVLQSCLLEVDGRLNGPDSPILGTQGDFAQRAARFVYNEVMSRNPGGDIASHRRILSRKIANWRMAKQHKRQVMSDEEIKKKIAELWDVADGRSGRMLRVLRDQEQIACEQGRFKGLFNSVRKSLNL